MRKEWKKVKIKEIGTVVSGGTPDTNKPAYWDGEIFWLTPTDLTLASNHTLSSTKRKITEDGLKNSSAKILPAYSVIVCTRASVGEIAINLTPMATNQGFKSIIPNSSIDVAFIYYQMLFHKTTLLKLACGSTFLEVSKSDFENLEILLPPLAEQKQIAAILRTWDTAIEKTEALIAAKERQFGWLKSKLLRTALEVYKDNIKSLSDVCKIIGGYAFKSSLMSSTPGKYQVIKISNLYKGSFDLSRNPSFLNDIDDRQKSFLLKDGDILITLTGTVGKRDYGYSVLIKEPNSLLVNQRVCLIRPDQSKMDSRFLLSVLQSRDFLELFYASSIGGTGNQTNVSIVDLGELEIKIPELSVQQNIAHTLNTAQREITLLKKLVEQYRTQKRGLMQKLLSGKWHKK